MDMLKKIIVGGLKALAKAFRRGNSAAYVEDVAFRSAPEVTVHDQHLIERSVTQWQFGDWPSLVLIRQETIEQHPERAKLALLVATANAQQGFTDAAREYAELAKKWGCPREIIARILIAGTYNSIGRAAAMSDDDKLTLNFFDLSLSTGNPGGTVGMMLHARIDEQYRQLGLPTVEIFRKDKLCDEDLDTKGVEEILHEPHTGQERHTNDEIQELTDALTGSLHANDADECGNILNRVSEALQKITKEDKRIAVDLSEIKYEEQKIVFSHARGDYIPEKIRREERFYESIFLEYLSKLHKKDGLIIDIGANIGNHVIFFGKVMKAEVIAIEPEPHNAFFLDLNIRINDLQDHVRVIKTAVGKSAGSVRIEMNVANNFGSFTAKPDANPNTTPVVHPMAIEVPTQTIDSLIRTHDINPEKISIIKIDVEGMEVEAILGAESIIKQSLPVVAVECFKHEDFLSIEKILKKHDYFPLEVVNATPTFIFISRKNLHHLSRHEHQLRESSIYKAAKYKGFVAEGRD